jgi:hypothetical protein
VTRALRLATNTTDAAITTVTMRLRANITTAFSLSRESCPGSGEPAGARRLSSPIIKRATERNG